MTYVTAQKNLLSQDLKQLLCHITGLDENSEEYKSVENNAWSTILHYSCPSIDKSSIRTQLYGFIEKFKIHAHSFPQKAKNLEMLFDRFWEINCYEEDIFWGLLNLLLLLSRRPTEAKEDDKPISFPLYKPLPEEDSFDWGAYLKEGLPNYRLPSSDEESLSDDKIVLKNSKEAIFQASREIRRQRQGNSFGCLSESTIYPCPTGINLASTLDTTLTSSQQLTHIRNFDESNSSTVKENRHKVSKEELKAALIAKEMYRRSRPSWWTDPYYREKSASKMPIPNACLTWEQNMSKKGVILGETRIISEAKAMKELISALDHPHDCFIIKRCVDGYAPREKVSICSTNPVDFYNALNEICPHLSVIENINSFIQVIDVPPIDLNSGRIAPYTLVAYAVALKDVMNSFKSFLSIIEAYIIKQDFIYMISYLMIEIRPWLKHLKFLFNIHSKAVDRDWKHQENWACAVRLLAVLYASIECSSGLEKSNLTIIFLKTIYPYISILETWLVHSQYVDNQDEFIIVRPSRHICEGSIVVRDYQTYLSNLSIEKSLFIDNFVYYSIRACSSVDFQIVLQKNIFESERPLEEVTPFYLEFVCSFYNEVKSEDDSTMKTCLISSNLIKMKYESLQSSNNLSNEIKCTDATDSQNTMFTPDKWNGTNFVYSDVLASAFTSVVHPTALKEMYSLSNFWKISRIFKEIENIDIDSIDITRILKKNFVEVITERMQPKGFAKDTLLSDYRLLEHINVLKCVHLFLNGFTMSIFSKSLFNKASINGLTTISWTNELRELLYKEYPLYYSNFIVTLPYDKLHFKKEFDIFENSYPDFIEFCHQIKINYLLEPPLNLVITPESIEKYNDLFNFLLQTKWALFCLSNLSFKDLSKGKQNSLTARLISLRLFLLHNVSTLEKYMISINSEDFDSEIAHVCSVARDIHVIATAHDKILNQRRKQCFLVGAPKILECIITIFKCCQIFSILLKMSFNEHFNSKICNELSNFELRCQDAINDLANGLLQIGKEHVFKNSVNFSFLCDELFNNMPGNWE